MDPGPSAPIERFSHLRDQPTGLAQAIGPRSRIGWVLRDGQFWVSDPVQWTLGSVPPERWPSFSAGEPVFLGVDDEHAYYALDATESPAASELTPAHFLSLREVLPHLDANRAELAMMAQSLLHWQQRHRYCGHCGARLISERAGHALRCAAAHCSKLVFPRLDPAIIVQVTTADRILLGRQKSWPAGRYSTLAGFVEAGETLEQAVIREVWEETGITVTQPRYVASQPWPFPASLMLGFTAKATTLDIQLHDGELEDARWFSVEDIQHQRIALPTRVSISHHLIAQWYSQQTGRPLPE